jgi:hypothetical protein
LGWLAIKAFNMGLPPFKQLDIGQAAVQVIQLFERRLTLYRML